jgi:Fe2+ or Zn2+ uptake regulation protein
MTEKENQKQKILHLLRILSERTDPDHAMTLAELSEELGRIGIKSERKSLYRDLHALTEAGFSVGVIRSRDVRYYWNGSPLAIQ